MLRIYNSTLQLKIQAVKLSFSHRILHTSIWYPIVRITTPTCTVFKIGSCCIADQLYVYQSCEYIWNLIFANF